LNLYGMAELESFVKVFGPLKKIKMAKKQEITKTNHKPPRYAFLLDDDLWMSVFLNNDGITDEFKKEIKSLDTGDHASFGVYKNKKGFLNINEVNGITIDGSESQSVPEVDVHDDLKEEKSGNSGQAQSAGALTNRDKIEIFRIAANNATANTKPENDVGDPEQWAVWYNTIRKTLEEDWWKF